MIPLNQSYRKDATLAGREDVRSAAEAYLAWAEPLTRKGRWYDYAIALASIDLTGKHVLELAARDSWFSPYVSEWVAEVTVTDLFGKGHADAGPLDQWTEAWKRSARRSDRLTAPQWPVDMCATGYRGESFDVVVNLSAIEHVRGTGDQAAMKEMARIVKPGGYVVLSTDTSDQFRHAGGYYYDEASLYDRLIEPSGLVLHGETDLSWLPCDKSPHKSGKFLRSVAVFVLRRPHAA